jgi:medium-chain acyl-[acyl-carrier-protein] hydrolase
MTAVTSRPGPVWTRSHRVRAYEIDAQGRLSVLTVCNLIQNAAAEHAHQLGISGPQLQHRHLTWVLARLLVDLRTYPAWQDAVVVTTWPSEHQRLMAFRHFDLHDGNARLVGQGASAWILMDTRTGRPQRLETLGTLMPSPAQRSGALRQPHKLAPLTRVDLRREYRVRYRDVDLNGHVNNVGHLEWILESLPPTLLHNGRLCRLEANFLAEAFAGDRVTAEVEAPREGDLVYGHCVRQTPEGAELIRAATHWQLNR